MGTITQIFPVPQGMNYYAVYTDERRKSGYRAERVDFLVLVKKQFVDFSLEGLSGNMMKPASCYSSYRGTFSEVALKSELPELWEEIKASGDFAVEPTLWEKFMTEQRDTLLFQNEQINLLKEKIAALKRGKASADYPEITPSEELYGKERTDFDFPNDDNYPFDTDTLLNGDTFDTEESGAEITKTVINPYADARNIIINNMLFVEGTKFDYRALNAFNASGIKTLGDVADKTFDELLQLKYIGRDTMENILAVLHLHGLTLKDEKSDCLETIAEMKRNGKNVTEIAKELNIPTGLVTKYIKYVWRDLMNFERSKKP